MLIQDFFNSFQKAASIIDKHIKKGSIIRIVTHNDADGLSSGGILALLALRKKAYFKISSEKRLDDKLIMRLKEEKSGLIIFSDFGSGYLDIITKYLKNDIIVIDHHIPIEFEADNIVHLNPILYGIEGSKEIAASGISYLLAKTINPENIDLACLGLLGALGDQQDKGELKSLIGLNKLIEFDAEEKGLLEKKVGLTFFGYETRPLPKAIAYTTTPHIPGLSGNEGSCVAFLKEIGIEIIEGEKLRTLADLSNKEKTMLFSAISNHMISSGCGSRDIHKLIGTIYIFKLEEPRTFLRSGREYGNLLNACGKMGKQGLGISVVLGDRDGALIEAQKTLEEYRRTIRESLEWIHANEKVEEMANIYTIRAENFINETVIGVISGILLNQATINKKKPIIATAFTDDEQLKISARVTDELVEQGLNLGLIMKKVAEQFGGGGGGHNAAAGAYIPIDREMNFLERVNKLVADVLFKKIVS